MWYVENTLYLTISNVIWQILHLHFKTLFCLFLITVVYQTYKTLRSLDFLNHKSRYSVNYQQIQMTIDYHSIWNHNSLVSKKHEIIFQWKE